MAKNLASRLDRLERLAGELLNRSEGPIYVSSLEGLSEADRERAILVQMVWVYAPARPEEPLESPPLSPAPSTKERGETEAERQKRWNAHLKAIGKDRYHGDEPRPVQPWEGIV
jgi:hypothetical protein